MSNSKENRICGSVNVYEIKPLKGPDRLLRMHVLIEKAWMMKDNINMLAELSKALIYTYHGIAIDFPTTALLEALPTNERYRHMRYGEQINGILGIEILFMRNSDSVFTMRYYTEHIEFERNLGDVDNYISRNKIDMSEYEPKFTLKDMREGISVEPVSIKINYTKPSNKVK
ncbi:hypothetical protein [Mucilaginibacter paludis]|uniref:Uncharacterized protein n=1 Tax=Mucilaginibacter paludis DSM 18603 TaxID=714943 RepID=H1Y5L6_9SPHI|nr:hypothetical protein [Mucilaginibacter paludis]EHQ29792.1 hypothetical protein Mucpa_5724 [Mucilaginibacter paludis DSM 18603]